MNEKRKENSVDANSCKEKAQLLFKTSPKDWINDDRIMIDIFAHCSFDEIREISQIYEDLSKTELLKAMKGQIRGESLMLLKTIITYSQNPCKYFAIKVFDAIDGPGTRDKLLIRTVVNRLEIDIKKVADEYKILYKKDMLNDILDDTSGNYQTLYESSIAYGIRTLLIAEENKKDYEHQIETLTRECEELENKINEVKDNISTRQIEIENERERANKEHEEFIQSERAKAEQSKAKIKDLLSIKS